MDVELYEKMDETMELMHQITGIFIQFAKDEISGKKRTIEQIENNKAIKMLFEKLQKSYRKLQDIILEEQRALQEYQRYPELDGDVKEPDSIGVMDNKKGPSELNYLTINDLDEYLENSYVELNYISCYDGNKEKITESIYKEFERMRNREYSLQQENLDDIKDRSDIQLKNPNTRYSFKEKARILRWIARDRFFKEYGFDKIEQCINVLAEKYKKNPTNELKVKIEALIEQKYILYLEYVNNKYNSLIQENEYGRLKITKEFIQEGIEAQSLNMTQNEIDENIKLEMERSKKTFKEIITSSIKSTKTQTKENEKERKNPKRYIRKITKNMERKLKEKVGIADKGEEK